MTYQIQTTISGEKHATVEDFLREVQDASKELNESWSTIKNSLPPEQQADAESKVRAVLPA